MAHKHITRKQRIAFIAVLIGMFLSITAADCNPITDLRKAEREVLTGVGVRGIVPQ